ncbi:MAG TPA: bifunctional phosphoribosylaminoimidazolecarboxamide formyltransferase/IMP cyclohydrolase [Bryobacteraceae bacterium]|nr:bifunctional phosphoribosylaminoimidazolecarboxamide formyltransferase/IMP cyclohydrolase [Bryobacteraceae bacterium]
MAKIQRALISLTDKSGILEFARGLAELGVEILSTGGTARMLRDAGLAVRDVADVTGFPEMLDGRVKTIHPRIAGGILAIRSNEEHMQALAAHGIPTIDMVVVNLYAFEKVAAREGATVPELIENIDIGGPTMIRAAAKNYQDVAVVVSPADYDPILTELRASGGLSLATHWRLAKTAYRLTADYDRAVSARLARIEVREGAFADSTPNLPPVLDLRADLALPLRYGENPHQSAALYSDRRSGIAGAEQLQGKELSYNNLVDLDAAWQLVSEFGDPASAIIKHTNPCGCAEAASLAESYRKALECDPVSAFGGVLAFNRPLDEETAREIAKTFIEAIAAPDYSQEALAVLAAKKNLRLLHVTNPAPDPVVIKSISGGFLAQTADLHRLDRAQIQVKTKRVPTEEEWAALEFGWKVVKHVKSNAIVFARAGQIAGVGAGQMSRVDSVKVAAMKAVLPLQGTALASDAFFPFPDGIEEAARYGATAVIQPGGSVKDAEVIAAANRLDLAMVFTGIRHFRH